MVGTGLDQGIGLGVVGEIDLWAEIWVPSLMGFGLVVLRSTAPSLDARALLAVGIRGLGLKLLRRTLMRTCSMCWKGRYHRSG